MSSAGHIPLIVVVATCIAVFADASPIVIAAQFEGSSRSTWAAMQSSLRAATNDFPQGSVDESNALVQWPSQFVPADAVADPIASTRTLLADASAGDIASLATPTWSSQSGEQPHHSIVNVALAGYNAGIQRILLSALSTPVEAVQSGDYDRLVTTAFARTPGESQRDDLIGRPDNEHRAKNSESPAAVTRRGPLDPEPPLAPVKAPAIPEPESLFLLGTGLLAAGFGARLIKRSSDRKLASKSRVPTSTP